MRFEGKTPRVPRTLPGPSHPTPESVSLHPGHRPIPMKFSLSEITDLIRHRRTIYPKDYTDRLVDQKWLRLAARRAHG